MQQHTKEMTTKGMLNEIGCSTAAKVVLETRYMNNSFGPTFITSLDDVLAQARPHPSGSRIERGDLIEVSGSSGSGKTSFLTFMLVTALLPSRVTFDFSNPSTIDLGGRSQYAALIHPVSHRSPVQRVEKGLRRYIHNAIHSNMGDITFKPDLLRQIDEIVTESLGRLRLIKIKPRNKKWALALRALQYPPLWNLRGDKGSIRDGDGEGEGGGEGGLDLVVCDGFSDGFYHDRHADERKIRPGGKKVVGLRGGEDVGMGDVMDSINHLREEMGTVVILSIQGLWTAPGPGPFFAAHLPSPYPSPFSPDHNRPTHAHHHHPKSNQPNSDPDPNDTKSGLNIQITLQGPVRPLQFPPDIPLVEALYSQIRIPQKESRTYQGHVRVVGGEGDIGSRGLGFQCEMGQTGVEVWHDT